MNKTSIESLTLKNDFLFCTVFTEYPHLLKEMIEIITGRKVKEIKNLEKQKYQDFDYSSKAIRLDVSFEDEESTIYHVEMEPSPKWNLPKRIRYYQSNSDALQISKGSSYSELHKTYIIFICGYDRFNRGLSKYTFRNYCEEVPGLELGDETVKIILNTEGYRNNISDELKNLLDYFCGQTSNNDKFIKDLDKAVDQVKNNKTWRERYMTLEEKFELYLENGKEIGRKEGIEEGIELGREEGVEITKKEMILAFVNSRRKDGYTEEEIAKEVEHIFSVDMNKLLAS